MLPRTLEPEFSEDGDEAWLYDQMDHAAVNQAFVDDLIAGGPVGPDVLDVGTGTARIPIALCEALPEVRVMGIDAATSMLDLARVNIDVAGLLDRIQLEHADAKQLESFSSDMFQTVVSNSLFHHLPEPPEALQVAKRLVTAGGRIFIRDLCRPASEAEVEELVKQYAGDEAASAQQLLRQSLHAALTIDEVRQCLTAADLDPQSVQRSSDRHWTIDERKGDGNQ